MTTRPPYPTVHDRFGRLLPSTKRETQREGWCFPAGAKRTRSSGSVTSDVFYIVFLSSLLEKISLFVVHVSFVSWYIHSGHSVTEWFPHDIFSLFPMIFPYSQYFPIINYFPMLFRQFSSDFPFISPWCSFDVPLLSDIFSHDQTLSLRGNASARVSRGRLRSAMPWSSSDWAKLL